MSSLFLTYRGYEYNKDDLCAAFPQKYQSNMAFSIDSENGIYFISADSDKTRKLPLPAKKDNTIIVANYTECLMADMLKNHQKREVDLLKQYYDRDGGEMFWSLPMSLCAVIWDYDKQCFIAGNNVHDDKDGTCLYYGYTIINHELMFSNSEELLSKLCQDVNLIDIHHYMEKGKILSTHEEDKRKGSSTYSDVDFYSSSSMPNENTSPSFDAELIKQSKENIDFLFSGLNALLSKVASEAVKDKIIANVNAYFASPDPKKRIEDVLTETLTTETKKQVLKLIKQVLEESALAKQVQSEVQKTIDSEMQKFANDKHLPITHIIKLNDVELGHTSGGFYHEKFSEILDYVHLGEPVMLVGPAGSGKNVCISQIAESLGLKMYYTSSATNEFKLTGFVDAGGRYQETEFYRAFTNGGIFCLDEIDNSDPSALIVINDALANGYMAFPHKTIKRHPDFHPVVAANTWGNGADLEYVGRNALDASTLDRFDTIFFDYDRNLEEKLYPNPEVLEFMWAFRDAVYKTHIPHIVSTRGIGKVYKKALNGIPYEKILLANVVKNLDQDSLNSILGSMDINSENGFYEAVKCLKLR